MPSTSADAKSLPLSESVKWRLWFAEYVSQEFPFLGKTKISEMRHAINATKGLTIVVAFVLMIVYGNTSHMGGWVYLALHGSYSILWVSKDYCFPDGWNVPCTLGGFVNTCVVLVGYWMSPYLLNSRHYEPSNALMAFAILTYILGVSLMFGADAQKYYQLKYKRGLITDGFFKYTRNPNYLGEMMLYGAFASLSGSIIPWLYLFTVWWLVFFPNMYKKDASIARYPEWKEYSERSGMLLPNFNAMAADWKTAAAPKDA